MTPQLNVARGRDIVARWCTLAEQRLEYLTELFETGRWRRFHSELDFLENIQEARTAVETWRSLSTREASFDNSAIDMSWLTRTMTALPRGQPLNKRIDRFKPPPPQVLAEAELPDVSIAAETAHLSSDEAPSAPLMDTPAALDIALEPALNMGAIERRYPLLRNAL